LSFISVPGSYTSLSQNVSIGVISREEWQALHLKAARKRTSMRELLYKMSLKELNKAKREFQKTNPKK
jgi:hypothetical protein